MSTRITYLGHSTVLVKSETISFLTDPIFSRRVLFLKRKSPMPVRPESLPEPTALFISHAHYDHLDIPSFKYFSSKTPVILPKGLGKLVARYVNNPLIELSPGGRHEIRPGLKVTAFPVSHQSFRLSGLTYRNACGYLIDLNGTRIFFPGDTAYRSDFKKLGKVDVALLPIGPTDPEWFMRSRHLNPADALKLFEEIQADLMIPIHWGTFRLGMEPAGQPLSLLKRLLSSNQHADKVAILEPGETREL